MKKILVYPACTLCFLFISLLFISCSEEQSVHEPFTYEPAFHNAYILCTGSELTPFNSFISFYNMKSNEFSQNIYGNHILPPYPNGIACSNNGLFISVVLQNAKMIKTDLNGNYLSEIDLSEKPDRLYSYDDKVITTSLPFFENHNTLRIFNASDMAPYHENENIHQYISDISYLNGKLYALLSRYNTYAIDSSLVVIQPPGHEIQGRLVLRDKPEALTLNNEGRFVIACSGSSRMFYTVDPGTMQKTDSAAAPVAFSKCLTADKNNPVVYYVSESDRIVKLNTSAKTFTNIIFNTNAGYTISGYIFDSIIKKHFVIFSSSNTALNGMLKIYNEDGALEQTHVTGKSPNKIIITRKQ